MGTNSPADTIFEQASRIFDGEIDEETGMRVLRLRHDPASPSWPRWRMVYHQNPTFYDGGRKVTFEYGVEPHVLDLTTGEWTALQPADHRFIHIHPTSGVAAIVLARRQPGREAILIEMASGRELVRFGLADWNLGEVTLLADGDRALALFWQGEPHEGPTRSRWYLLDSNGGVQPVLEEEGFFCNHLQGCPTDPDLISYNRWPCPKQDIPQIMHLRRLDGSFHEMLPLLPETVRPGHAHGWQRDHYVWSPDGRRILSYFNAEDDNSGDHFQSPGWWVSAMDWKTGEDLAAPYPPGRWGCNFNVTPDARFIVAAGGPDFQYIFAIEIEALRNGWNEHKLCRYAPTTHDRVHLSPYHMPWALPDGSGVIYAAGWHGADDGLYMVEWPRAL